MSPNDKLIDTDILVIGSGIAGLSFALKASSLGKVLVISKSSVQKGSTELAQGGIASVQSPADSVEQHIADTLNVGYGLAREDVVRSVVEYGIRAARELVDLGVPLDTEPGLPDKLALGLEGGHSRKRIIHVADATGRAVEEAYIAAVKRNPNIELLPDHCAIDLLTQHNLPVEHPLQKTPVCCWGAYVLDENRSLVRTVRSKITLLATGGGGRLYLHTT
ncbi:L-aspartate oxidase, partial [bacterium]